MPWAHYERRPEKRYWMAVRIAKAILAGEPVHVVAATEEEASVLMRMVAEIIKSVKEPR